MEGHNGISIEHDNEKVKDNIEDDNDHTMQDPFLDFLDGVSTPEQDQFTMTELKKVAVRDWKVIHPGLRQRTHHSPHPRDSTKHQLW